MNISCPYCMHSFTLTNSKNNQTYRCGLYKTDLTMIEPNLTKAECIQLFHQKKIFGCGNPFMIQFENNIPISFQ